MTKLIAIKDGKQIDLGVYNVREPLHVKNETAETPKSISFKCEFAMSKENDEALRKLREDLEKIQWAAMDTFSKKVDTAIEYILRNHVTPPIKGEITKGKVRWRGLQAVWHNTENGQAFIGIRQRDTLITLDGKKIPFPTTQKREAK